MIGRQLGKLMYEFRKASNDFKFQMEEELRTAEEADRRKKEEEARQRALAAAPPQLEAATSQTPAPVSETPSAVETQEAAATQADAIATQDSGATRATEMPNPAAATGSPTVSESALSPERRVTSRPNRTDPAPATGH